MTTERIDLLLADDDTDDCDFFRDALSDLPLTTTLTTVHNGVELMKLLTQKEYELPYALYLDLNMPRMNGFEFLQWLREDSECGHMVIYVLSASARDADVKRAYELGANCYIVKPSRMDELVSLVAAMHQWHRFTVLPTQSAPEAVLTAHTSSRAPAATCALSHGAKVSLMLSLVHGRGKISSKK